jgi:hypothetical protein
MTDIVERLLRMVPVDMLGGKPMLLNPDGPAAVNEIDQLRNEIINFRAEIERLRKALELIADTDPDDGADWFHKVARAALEGK